MPPHDQCQQCGRMEERSSSYSRMTWVPTKDGVGELLCRGCEALRWAHEPYKESHDPFDTVTPTKAEMEQVYRSLGITQQP